MAVVPEPLSAGALAALEALEQYTATSLADLDAWHKEMFREYRDELERYFQRYSDARPPDEDGKPRPSIWGFAAVQDRVASDLVDSFNELADALYDEDVSAMTDGLDDMMVEGGDRELWLLAMGGLDIDPYRKALPKKRDRILLLLGLGVLGVSWMDRRAQWRDQSRDATARWLKSSVLGGRTLDETLEGYDRLTGQFTNRVKGLYADELKRSFDVGADVALTAARRDHDIKEIWLTREDRLVCPICAPLHKKVTPLQPITDTHPSCLPGSTVVGHAEVLATSKRFYEGSIVMVQTAGGNRLTVTPNHPILTVRGWKLAGEVYEGDQVVCCDGKQRVRFCGDDHDKDMPSTIAEVHEAALCSVRMSTVEVKQTAEHFHGDGTTGHVAQIRTDRVLLPWGVLPSPQQRRQSLLRWARKLQLAVAALGPATQLFRRKMPTPAGTMRRFKLGMSSFGVHAAPFDHFRCALVAQRDAPLLQITSERVTTYASVLRELQERYPGQISLSQVTSVERKAFVGHVYNIQTMSGYYTGSGIVVKNCRCRKVPVPDDYRETEADYGALFGET